MTKEHFLAGWEVALDGSEDCQKFLLTQAVERKTAENLSTYIHLKYNDEDLLEDAKIYSEGKLETNKYLNDNLQLEKAIGILKYRDLPTHHCYNFENRSGGIHQLGGEWPAELTVPENNFVVPFQYLGFIDNTDTVFSWLPFKLHMLCPIYLNFNYLFLDYSNPLKPLILNHDEVAASDTSYEDDLNKETEIIFEPVRFNTKKIYGYGGGLGSAGLPKWIQEPDIPNCPKTGKIMKFVCQLQGNGVAAKRTNVNPKDEWYRSYYEELNFWGDGDLFVFFEPESKVACYFIQNT